MSSPGHRAKGPGAPERGPSERMPTTVGVTAGSAHGQLARSALVLQRSAGNRATLGLLRSAADRAAPVRGVAAEIALFQRTGSQVVRRKDKKGRAKARSRKRARRRNAQRQQQPPPQPQGAGGGLWSWFSSFVPGSTSYEAPSEEQDDDDGDGLLEDIEEEGGSDEELNLPDEPEDAKSIGEKLLQPFMPESLSIELGKAGGERKGTRVGDVKGSAEHTLKADLSTETELKGSVEGRSGQGSAEAKVVNKLDAVEGEGKVEMLLGAKHERQSGTLGWQVEGHQLQGSGQLAYMRGLMLEGVAKAKYDLTSGDLVAAAKAGAFAGVRTEGTVRIKYLSGGKDFGETEARLGLSWGIGGELQGSISWKGGVLALDGSGSFAVGAGMSYRYKLSLNTTNVVQAAPGLLWSLWHWMTTVPEGTTEEDFWV